MYSLTNVPLAGENLMTDPGKKPTLKTIAYMTGLGITTVGKALRDAPDIKASTKERVKLIANQIGYKPDSAGRRLRTGKTNVISLVLDTGEQVSNMTTEFLFGVTTALNGTPYSVVVNPYSHNDDHMVPLHNIVETRGADGIILSRIQPVDPRLAYLKKSAMPFATHGRSNMGIDHAYTDFDCTAFGRNAVEILAKNGAKRICLLSPPRHLAFAQYIHDGYIEGLQNSGLDVLPLPSVTSDDPVDAIAHCIAQLFNQKKKPDGFICTTVPTTIGVIGGIEMAGLTVGEDVNVVAKQSTGNNLLKWFGRPVFDIEEDFRAIGHSVASSLLKVIEGAPVTEHQNVIFPEQWGRSVLR